MSLFISVFLFPVLSLAAELKIEAKKIWTLPSDYKVDSKRVGGLSGCSVLDDKIYLVSDDRGSEGGPRLFVVPFDEEKSEIDFNKAQVIKLKPAKKMILDMEGIGVLDKENILLSSEGDLNQKPRQPPELFWINSLGKKTKAITIPEEFIPEKSGQQTKGVRNNLAFEGLVVDTELKKWAALTEASLMQTKGVLKLVESGLNSTQFDRIYDYPIPKVMKLKDEEDLPLTAFFGASEILMISKDSYLVLERGVALSGLGIVYRSQFCEASKVEGSAALKRSCHYNMNEDERLKQEIPFGANFEGLCWINKQKKHFIAISDNNFSKNEKSVFILYQLN